MKREKKAHAEPLKQQETWRDRKNKQATNQAGQEEDANT